MEDRHSCLSLGRRRGQARACPPWSSDNSHGPTVTRSLATAACAERHFATEATMRTPPYGFEFFENCTTCKWRTEGFFCNLPDAALAAFDTIAFTNVYPEGAVLYAEGQPPRGV